MTIDRVVMAFAGLVVATAVLLSWLVAPSFMLLAAFAGINLLQAAFTRFCPLAILLRKLGLQPGSAFR